MGGYGPGLERQSGLPLAVESPARAVGSSASQPRARRLGDESRPARDSATRQPAARSVRAARECGGGLAADGGVEAAAWTGCAPCSTSAIISRSRPSAKPDGRRGRVEGREHAVVAAAAAKR